MIPEGGGKNKVSPTIVPVHHLEGVTRSVTLREGGPRQSSVSSPSGDMELGVWGIQSEELIILGFMLIYKQRKCEDYQRHKQRE